MQKYISAINEFRSTEKARKLILNAVKELLPDRDNWLGFLFSFVIGCIVAKLIGFSENTVTLFQKTSETILNIQLALFGCVFTVYSIIITFLSDDVLRRLAEIEETKKASSFLKKSVMYYESILLLYFLGIAITGILCLLVNCIAEDFRLTNNLFFDNTFATVLLVLYFVFTFRLFYEIKSTIYNTIALFRASIAFKFIGFAHEEAANSHKNQETMERGEECDG